MKIRILYYILLFSFIKNVYANTELECINNEINEKLNCLSNKIEKLNTMNVSLINSINKLQTQVESNLQQTIPAGTVVAFAGANIPDGWLLCDGRFFLTSQYPSLYQAIGKLYGGYAGYFNIPDYRGLFLRGVSGARSDQFADLDKLTRIFGERVGSLQLDSLSEKPNLVSANNLKIEKKYFLSNSNNKPVNKINDNVLVDDTVTKKEFRPKNVYVYYIIKY